MIRRRVRICGKVQGVGFRYHCQEAAEGLGVNGWVRNCPDGSVELEAEAEDAVVTEFFQRIKTCHPWARVDRWEEAPASLRGSPQEGFQIVL